MCIPGNLNRPTDMTTSHPVAPSIQVVSKPRAGAPNLIQADRLFQGSQEILIAHNGETYRLRITRNGKLILTK